MPQVNFYYMTPEDDAALLSQFLLCDASALHREDIFPRHPDLGDEKNLTEQKIKKYVFRFWDEHQQEILKKPELFQRAWAKVNDKVMGCISEVVELDWPKNRDNIVAAVSINPICPRYLDTWLFTVYYKDELGDMRATVAHELVHFLYFEKWKQVFPSAKQGEFEAPHLIWILSEILAPVLVNTRGIQKHIKRKNMPYQNLAKIQIDGKGTDKYFAEMYAEYKQQNKHFGKFLVDAYAIAVKNRKKLQVVQ